MFQKHIIFSYCPLLQHLYSPSVWKLSFSSCLFKAQLLKFAVCCDWSALEAEKSNAYHISASALLWGFTVPMCWLLLIGLTRHGPAGILHIKLFVQVLGSTTAYVKKNIF